MRPSFAKAWVFLPLIAGGIESATAFAASARIVGRVYDPDGLVIPGVTVVLAMVDGSAPVTTKSGPDGKFTFDDLPPGRAHLSAAQDGYQQSVIDVELKAGELTRVRVSLLLAGYSETVTATPTTESTGVTPPARVEELGGPTLELLPTVSDRFIEALPLLPGVVRTPDGKLSFNGARASQSTLQVNGATVTDPLTGDFAIDLPLKAIDEVEVTSLPYAPEFGRVSAAVTKVLTRAGGDSWKFETGNFFPSPRFRNGKLAGFNSFTPEVRVSGPIRVGKAWFSQSFAYRFVRSRAYDIPEGLGEDERILRTFDVLSQLDWRVSAKHYLTTTFAYFPIATDNVGLDSLHPEETTPDFESWGWNVAIADRVALSEKTLVEGQVAVKSFDVAMRPKGTGATLVQPTGLRGNYFNTFDRQSGQVELNFSLSRVVGQGGRHLLKVGAAATHSDFQGTDRNTPISVLGQDGRLLRTIEFVGEGAVGAGDTEVGGYIQDRWQPSDRVTLEFGMRYDFDQITSSHRPVPRVAVAYAPFEDGRSVIRGGWGVFYERVFVHAASFERFQSRVETDVEAGGAPVVLPNRLDERLLKPPRALTWNVEFDRRLTETVMLRANYTERWGNRELVVDKLSDALLLSSRGESTSRQFDVTLRKRLRHGGELLLSYAHAHSTRDLNSFELLYGNQREPILHPSEYSLDPYDVPHRWLTWGTMKLPFGIELAPALEIRSGFPYTIVDERQDVVGARNQGGRFPLLFSLDVRVMKSIRFGKRTVKVGGTFYNLTSHFNPRDVQANLASPSYGTFANSPNVSFGFRLSIGQ